AVYLRARRVRRLCGLRDRLDAAAGAADVVGGYQQRIRELPRLLLALGGRGGGPCDRDPVRDWVAGNDQLSRRRLWRPGGQCAYYRETRAALDFRVYWAVFPESFSRAGLVNSNGRRAAPGRAAFDLCAQRIRVRGAARRRGPASAP